MITKLEFELKLPDSIKFNYLGSIMHGVIMEYLSDEIVESLHHDFAYSPLKQRVYRKKEKVVWEIVSLSEELSKELVFTLSSVKVLRLKHYNQNIEIKLMDISKIDVNALMNKHLNESNLDRFITIKVKTPMSFKSNKMYSIFPDVKLIFRSIMIQCNAFFEEYQIYDNETLDFIENNVSVVNYNLKSTRFHLEKVKIPSFVGEITFKVKGPQPLLQLVHFLMNYGELSGSGIKTSLGMGKYSLVRKVNG